MSLAYRTVGWNPQKRRYDAIAGAGVIVYLALFLAAQAVLRPELTIETLLIRAFGSAALVLLHVVLSIGPLARLDRRFLPLLYNRRHLGVMTFSLGLAHGLFAIVQFHGFGTLDPLVSVFVSNPRYDALLAPQPTLAHLAQIPFQPFGLVALVILFLMAATSHDFWLHNLSAPVWKALHMGVYVAYASLVLHVMFGVLQGETHASLAWMLTIAAAGLLSLHVAAARREVRADVDNVAKGTMAKGTMAEDARYVDVCAVDDIPERRAVITCLTGERVAIFRYDGKVSALSNVCQHQNGPLGEGRIVNDCVVCPWHGYEYLPDSGASPAPFTEKVPTFNVRLAAGRVLVDPRPNPPGTRVAPALIDPVIHPANADEFYIGYDPPMPPGIARFVRRAVLTIGAGVPIAAGLLAIGHRPLDGGTFEFGSPRTISGTIASRPYPAIRLDSGRDSGTGADAGNGTRTGTGSGARRETWALLVAPGKHGADSLVSAFDGERVMLEGTRIQRGDHLMFEVTPGTIARKRPTDAATPMRFDAGASVGAVVTLRGEIVDSKCHLGVMVPGEGKTHKDCASLCLRGGIPPALLVRDREGRSALLLLVSGSGEPVGREAVRLAGEPVEVTGAIVRAITPPGTAPEGWPTLRTDPSTWRPLAASPR
jgi:sulfoxide reductase heme-binding subunit YedZ